MAWFLLVLSGLIETGWALGLKASHGLTRPVPAVLTIAAMLLSFGLLAYASRSLPVGTAYAVWVGIGTVGATVAGIAIYGEPVSLARVASVALVIGGVIGLKLTTPT